MGIFSNPEKEKRKAAEARARAAAERVNEQNQKNERARQKASAASSAASSKAIASIDKSRVQREKIEADKLKALAKLSPEEREKLLQDIEEKERLEIELMAEKTKQENDLMTEQKRREMELEIENERNLYSLEQSKAEGKLKLKRLELEEKYRMWESLPAYEKEKILKKRDDEEDRIINLNSRNKKIVFGIWMFAVLVVIVSIVLSQIEVEEKGTYITTTRAILHSTTAYLISIFTLMGAFMGTSGFKFNKKREQDQWEKMLSIEEPEEEKSVV